MTVTPLFCFALGLSRLRQIVEGRGMNLEHDRHFILNDSPCGPAKVCQLYQIE